LAKPALEKNDKGKVVALALAVLDASSLTANSGVVSVKVPPPAKPWALIALGSIDTRALI
jgi:hypothetical protein